LPILPGRLDHARASDSLYQIIGNAVRNSVFPSKLVARPPTRTVLVRRFGVDLSAIAGATVRAGVARAKASLGGRAAGGDVTARVATFADGGTMVGRLVSITIRSGHSWLE
jgi:hypothetical protein